MTALGGIRPIDADPQFRFGNDADRWLPKLRPLGEAHGTSTSLPGNQHPDIDQDSHGSSKLSAAFLCSSKSFAKDSASSPKGSIERSAFSKSASVRGRRTGTRRTNGTSPSASSTVTWSCTTCRISAGQSIVSDVSSCRSMLRDHYF